MMFEGDFAEMYGEFFAHVHGGPSGGSCMRRPESEDHIRMSGICCPNVLE